MTSISDIQATIDAIPDLVVLVDTAGTIREWNDAALEATAYGTNELAGMSVSTLFDPDPHAAIEDEPHDAHETRLTTAAGETRPYECSIRPLDGREGLWLVRGREQPTVDADPLDSDRAGYAENLLDQMFTQIPTSLYIKDTEGRHLYLSDHYDVEPERALGKTDTEIYPTALAEQTYADDMHVIETGEPILDTEEYNPADDDWVLTSKVPWYGDDGEIKGLMGVSRIITEKKEYEKAIETQNERLDRFAGVISHDLRNPLNTAMGYADLVAAECESEHVEPIQQALDRMDTLIGDVLMLARQGETIDSPERVTVAAVAQKAWRTIDHGEATLEITLDDSAVEADPGRLRQVFENLFHNAVAHGGETVSVQVGTLDSDDGFYVDDNGAGIPPEERDDIFDHGYTQSCDGTGFGLAIVEEIVAAHGWQIRVTEGRDGGVRFEIRTTGLAEDPDVAV